jgi:LysM repeat protein
MRIKAFTAALTIAAIAGVASTPSAHAATQNTNPNTDKKNVVVVNAGDTLSGIATDHQTTYVRLFDANEQVADPDIIHPGEKIRVPGPNEQLPSRQIPQDAPVAAPAPAPVAKPAATPVATVAPAAPAPRPAPVAANYSTGSTVWDRLAQCESGGNWAISTGNGFYGGLQFTLSSWSAVGGSGYPNMASREEQISRAQMLQARQGWGAWPACSAKLGL